MLLFFLAAGVIFSAALFVGGHFLWSAPQQAERQALGARLRDLHACLGMLTSAANWNCKPSLFALTLKKSSGATIWGPMRWHSMAASVRAASAPPTLDTAFIRELLPLRELGESRTR